MTDVCCRNTNTLASLYTSTTISSFPLDTTVAMKESSDKQNDRRSLSSSTTATETSVIRAHTQENVYRATSHISGHDVVPITSPDRNIPYQEAGDEIYDALSVGQKRAIVAVLSFGAFLSPISSTSVLAATPEVANSYDTSGSVINVSNAAYMVVMAISPVFWGPMSQVFGRRLVSVCKACAWRINSHTVFSE